MTCQECFWVVIAKELISVEVIAVSSLEQELKIVWIHPTSEIGHMYKTVRPINLMYLNMYIYIEILLNIETEKQHKDSVFDPPLASQSSR